MSMRLECRKAPESRGAPSGTVVVLGLMRTIAKLCRALHPGSSSLTLHQHHMPFESCASWKKQAETRAAFLACDLQVPRSKAIVTMPSRGAAHDDPVSGMHLWMAHDMRSSIFKWHTPQVAATSR